MANQYVNKVVFAGTTLIDLTGDDATAADVLSGKKFHTKDGANATGTCAYDMDTSDADALASEILAGKKAGVNGSMVTGTIPTNSSDVTVTSKSGTTIPLGYSDGSTKAVIDSASSSALVANNVRQGVTILGVEGTMTGTEDVNAQAKTVAPSTSAQTVLPDTPTYNYLSQVTVSAVTPVYTDNSAGGRTCSILSA